MMLAMDGVVRRSPLTAIPQRMPEQEPAVIAARATRVGTIRYVTGMDGISRAVLATPARQVIESLQAPLITGQAASVMMSETVSDSSGYNWGRTIAMGLVASALATSGVYGWQAATAHAIPVAQAQTRVASVQAAATRPTPDPAVAAAALAVTQQQAGLQKLLGDFTASNPSQFGIVVKDLKTGATSSVNADASMTSASLYKLFVAQQIYGMIDNGQLSSSSPAGSSTGRSVEECLTIMINISDNACGQALGTILGWESQDARLKADGYTGTSLQTPQRTSSSDVASLFEKLYRSTLNAPTSNARFMDLLKDQRINNRLPAGLPSGTMMAHKTGDLDGYMHDAGIVYGPKTDYLVVVMGAPGANPGQFADLSSRLWAFFQQ